MLPAPEAAKVIGVNQALSPLWGCCCFACARRCGSPPGVVVLVLLLHHVLLPLASPSPGFCLPAVVHCKNCALYSRSAATMWKSEARNDCVRDWSGPPDPLGCKALPLVLEVYGWLSWATSGTTRGLRNRPFHAVLLCSDGGNREVPPGGWVAREDHERVLRALVLSGWPYSFEQGKLIFWYC